MDTNQTNPQHIIKLEGPYTKQLSVTHYAGGQTNWVLCLEDNQMVDETSWSELTGIIHNGDTCDVFHETKHYYARYVLFTEVETYDQGSLPPVTLVTKIKAVKLQEYKED